MNNPAHGAQLAQKNQSLPPLKTTPRAAQPTDCLEVDELCACVRLKPERQRIWIVQCRRTRRLLSFCVGDGSAASCLRLWRRLPAAYHRCSSFSDFWRAYRGLTKETPQMVGRETGETAHEERLKERAATAGEPLGAQSALVLQASVPAQLALQALYLFL